MVFNCEVEEQALESEASWSLSAAKPTTARFEQTLSAVGHKDDGSGLVR